MTATNRDEWIYMAKITEQTERFEDMLEAMNKVVQANADLSVEERNLLSVAYKNTIGSRRTAWRALSSIEKKEEQKGSKNIGLLRDTRPRLNQSSTSTAMKFLISLILNSSVKPPTLKLKFSITK
jgi:14-3-3 protein epsilon